MEVPASSIPTTTLVGCIYRPPSSSVGSINAVCDLLDQALTMRDLVVACGDLNVNLMDPDNHYSSLLSNYITTRALLQPINTPTRITPSSATLLDIFLITSKVVVKSANVLDVGISDHSAICLCLCWHKPKLPSSSVLRRSYKRFDPEKFIHDLSLIPWSVGEVFDNVDDRLDFFNQMFLQVLDNHAPLRRLRVKRNGVPWVTKDLRHQMDNRDKLLRRFRKTRAVLDWECYRQQRNKVRTLLRNSKIAHFSNLIDKKAHPSTLWRALKAALPTPKPNWSCFGDNSKSLANKFNHHFAAVASSFPTPVNHAEPRQHQATSLSLQAIEVDECHSRLMELNPRKSTGADGIPPSMLRIAGTVIAAPLCSIINLSLSTGSFPTSWKNALVKPLHKSGPRNVVSNYRPISLLPVASKILERVVRDQVYSHLSANHLLSPCQTGFRPGHSTTTTLLYVTNECYQALNKGLFAGAVFLDISKAFDTVNHDLLLSRLSELGLDSTACQWFDSYLCCRQHRTVIGVEHSSSLATTSGVPQGSVLGPLLFSIFINNLPHHLHGVITVLFADDTTMIVSGRSISDISDALTKALASAHEWLVVNGLQLNTSKTKCMLIHSNHRKPSSSLDVQLGGKSIEQVQTYKFLGVLVNDTLTWTDHVNLVCSKVSKGINLLRLISWFLPKESLVCYYNAYILPHFTYADSVWTTCTAAQNVKLERLQNYAARLILRQRREVSATCMREQLGWPTLASRRRLSEAVVTFRCTSGLSPLHLSTLFKSAVSIHCHGTRSASSNSLHLPRVATGFGKRSFAFRGAQLWNLLPPDLRQTKHPNRFMTIWHELIYCLTSHNCETYLFHLIFRYFFLNSSSPVIHLTACMSLTPPVSFPTPYPNVVLYVPGYLGK